MSSSAELAYRALKDRLLEREFEAGHRLKETALASELGVSRTPLRQALHRLVAEGWLEQSPRQGVRVREWTEQDIYDIFDIRLLLEPHAAAMAARRRSDAQLEQLREAAHVMQRCLDETDEHRVARRSVANAQFHETIQQAAGNARLSGILTDIVQFAMVARTYQAFRDADERRSCAHHYEMVDAIAARDADWARAVMAAHITAARHTMLARLTSPHGEPAPSMKKGTS